MLKKSAGDFGFFGSAALPKRLQDDFCGGLEAVCALIQGESAIVDDFGAVFFGVRAAPMPLKKFFVPVLSRSSAEGGLVVLTHGGGF
ncbi:MAG: hypothetical protein ABSG68_21025 [Thermoguttaceae bacterium]